MQRWEAECRLKKGPQPEGWPKVMQVSAPERNVARDALRTEASVRVYGTAARYREFKAMRLAEVVVPIADKMPKGIFDAVPSG